MKTLIIILLNICFLFSCSLPQNRNLENVYVLNLDEANNNDFYSMFDSVTYISLETQSDNEIGQISRILYHYGKYIVTDMLTNRVFIFNEDGKYYSKIDAIGNGPEEYVQITDITIDKYNERIKVLDAMQGKIVSYDLEGYSVGETKLPVVPAPLHFCQVEKEKYAFDFQRCSSEKEWQYNLFISSEYLSGEISKFLPYDKPLDVCFSPRITLQEIDDEVLYIPLYSPTIYTIDSFELKPRYTFDFGDKWVDQDFVDIEWKDAGEFMNKLSRTKYVYYFNLLESGSHIYAEFMYKENKYRLVIDKETDHLFLQRETEAYKCHYTEIPMCCIGNKFVIPLTPFEYNSMIGDEAIQLPEDNNPILMFVTFKKF